MPRLLIGPVLRHVGTTDATVWVETDAACAVDVLGHTEDTWTVGGHHYALVTIDGLAPGTSVPYEVRLDGEQVWPPLDSSRPASRIRTQQVDATEVRLAFGSCRYQRGAITIDDKHFDDDSLACLSRELTRQDEATWPDGVL
ncbi:MAG TPA: hypothetical protein VFE19_14420, partial [Jatrophihabitantaceae bacterium]|nr:hypothetical protein [Jatrophihabitantaceae bacterium]